MSLPAPFQLQMSALLERRGNARQRSVGGSGLLKSQEILNAAALAGCPELHQDAGQRLPPPPFLSRCPKARGREKKEHRLGKGY